MNNGAATYFTAAIWERISETDLAMNSSCIFNYLCYKADA